MPVQLSCRAPQPRIDAPVMALHAERAAHAARASTGTYVLFGTYNTALANRIVARVKSGGYPAFSQGLWDATRRRGEVWIMYVC